MEMHTAELPLFSSSSLPIYTQDQIIEPLTQVFDEYPKRAPLSSLQDLFPEQQFEDKEIKKVRELLGSTGADMTTDEMKTFISGVRYLCDSILDNFERNVFQGMTLQELLNEG